MATETKDPMEHLNAIYAKNVTAAERAGFINELSDAHLQNLVHLITDVAQRALNDVARLLYEQAQATGSTHALKLEADRISALIELLVEPISACQERLKISANEAQPDSAIPFKAFLPDSWRISPYGCGDKGCS